MFQCFPAGLLQKDFPSANNLGSGIAISVALERNGYDKHKLMWSFNIDTQVINVILF